MLNGMTVGPKMGVFSPSISVHSKHGGVCFIELELVMPEMGMLVTSVWMRPTGTCGRVFPEPIVTWSILVV